MAFKALTVQRFWDANANNLALRAGFGTDGDAYLVTVAGATDIGQAGAWAVGDVAYFALDRWLRIPCSISVVPVSAASAAATAAALIAAAVAAIDLSPYATKAATLAQFASTTSAQLKALLSDETGSGAAVFATAPDLANPTVTTQAAGDATTKAASTAFVAAAVAAAVTLPRSYLAGLTLSAAGGTATFGVAAGQAADSTNAAMMALAAAYTKTGSAWAVGSGNGGIDTGAIANSTWYHVYLIKRVDTGVVDVIFSTNATSPALPTNYTLFRRIGSMLTNGSAQWVAFTQDGDLFQWVAPVADINASNPGTAAVTRTLTVPLGLNVMANVQFAVVNTGSAGGAWAYLSDLATNDVAPTGGGVSDLSYASNVNGGVIGSYGRVSVRTNTSKQVRSRVSYSDGNVSVTINTLGWTDSRGRNA